MFNFMCDNEATIDPPPIPDNKLGGENGYLLFG